MFLGYSFSKTNQAICLRFAIIWQDDRLVTQRRNKKLLVREVIIMLAAPGTHGKDRPP